MLYNYFYFVFEVNKGENISSSYSVKTMDLFLPVIIGEVQRISVFNFVYYKFFF